MTLAEAIAAGDLLAVARCYVGAGLSVIPVHADGTKAPKHSAWTRYGDALPTQAELKNWFGRGESGGIGICGGPASGNLTVLDFETAKVWGAWRASVPTAQVADLELCPLVRTPGGGAHLYVRLELPTRGVTLAERPNGVDGKGRPCVKTLIETRAHGEQVLAPGCPAECHPLKKLYTWERTTWVTGCPSHVVPLEVWMYWTEQAAALTEVEQKPEEPRLDTRNRSAVSADDSGTDFNRRGTWEETGLFECGWAWERHYGDDRGAVRRPGKARGVSGTLGLVSSSASGAPLFHCFTSNGAPFEARGNYDRFGAYARLKHGGDFKAASKALRALGYGKRYGPEPSIKWERTATATPSGRGFKWASELAAPPKADDWVWEGYLPRGAVALLSALWKAGKTTLLSHLLKACATGGDFLGKSLKACKVLYVSEEGERHWVRRRDALGLGDHAGFYLQPFATRPAHDGWVGFIDQLKKDVEEHGFDLVVFDTLAKLWPVTEENDAGSVDAALMALWKITKVGACVLLIHHLRKSGGQEYTGSRGSGALSAFPDILIELTRFEALDAKCKKRVLRAKGRYEETPDELVVELRDGAYVHVPEMPAQPPGSDPKVAWSPTEEDRIVEVMRLLPDDWIQIDDLRNGLRAKGWGMRDEDVSTHLASLYFREQVVLRGKLRSKTQPREYALASRSTPGSGGNETRGNELPGA